MKQAILSRHGTIIAFSVAIGKNHIHVRRVVKKADAGDLLAQAKVAQWMGEPLRLWTRGELMTLVNADGGLANVQARVARKLPKANLLNFFNRRSEPKIITPLYAALCNTLGVTPYKQS